MGNLLADRSVLLFEGRSKDKGLLRGSPGAKNKNVRSSNDYGLDEWGSSSVLLFLRKDGDSYVPLSPQGVVAVEKSETSENKYELTF